ncbi:type I-E CRISPR-associated protein Cse1/CasA [Galbitalea sp. SE-J8]|uniref:type I-E CRISPR-associated protein Cse1/CasA n=1 Tax=Galbitalea sp. SE-J8 TaxID=3054952 RepID=UPI00259CDCB4|nr:type I-E CRISPR-associated protein Cse1/CasA [Galbitalea sp. SE-J8]MDM4762830.1 type I-E CRISPR-associated protein Cse1/CasA [Galbitalea sp. SE-J8]
MIDEPWIPVATRDGATAELSLADVFRRADDIRGLATELPTVDFAILRVLLAILERALGEFDDPISTWASLRRDGLPTQRVLDYLEHWRHRFDLLDDAAPFFQTANLTTGKPDADATLDRLLPDASGGGLFSMRRGAGVARISFAEAARFVLHSHSYGLAGIHGSALGDPRAKGGKVYPLGTGGAGSLGGVVIEGETLAETLVLNLVLGDREGYPLDPDDEPAWERSPLGPAEEGRSSPAPRGPAEFYTWQSRRIRLVYDESGASGAVVCYGDRPPLQNGQSYEFMTAWRRSEAYSKQQGTVVKLPVRHRPDRAAWRGLGSLLPHIEAAREDTDAPRTLTWLAEMRAAGALTDDAIVRTRTIGIEYGTQDSVIVDVLADRVDIRLSMLGRDAATVAQKAIDMAAAAELGVRALGDLARNLELAAGGSSDGARDRSTELAYDALDQPYRAWLRELNADTDRDTATRAWVDAARTILLAHADNLVEAAGAPAWRGRDVKGLGGTERLVNAAIAHRWFLGGLAKALPRAQNAHDDRIDEQMEEATA